MFSRIVFQNPHNSLFHIFNLNVHILNLIGYRITRSNTFDNKSKTLTGWKFVLSVGSSYVCKGEPFAFFKVAGNFPLIKA